MAKQAFANYEEFWPFYLTQHAKRSTRGWHFVGTTFMFACLAAGIFYHLWFLLLAPVVAYGCAWYSHFFIEGNKPATFGHPFWSLRADFRMYRMILLGQLEAELQKQEISQKR